MIRILLWVVVCFCFVFNVQSQSIDSLPQRRILYEKTADSVSYQKKKHFWRAAGEMFDLNVGLWAFDRYVLDGPI